MIFIVGDRQTGKTFRLINLSALWNIPILVANRRMADVIETTAERWQVPIPKPCVIEPHIARMKPEPVLIDELPMILERMGYEPVVATTAPSRLEILEERGGVSLKEALSVWWRSRKDRHEQ